MCTLLDRCTYLTEVVQLDVHAAAQTRADVGGARAQVAESLAPHELALVVLHQTLHLVVT